MSIDPPKVDTDYSQDTPLKVTDIEDVTPDRLSVVESSLRDLHRQLRVVRSNQVGLVASMAAKIEDLGKRLDGTDRRVAALKEGVNDAHDVLVKHEDRLTAIEKRSAWKFLAALMAEFHGQDVANRVRKLESQTYEQEKVIQSSGIGIMAKSVIAELNAHSARVGAVEATLARIEDCLTSAAPMMPPRKSLGWLNVTPQEPTDRGTFMVLHPTRAAADKMASMRRLACIEIFEGDGL